MNDGSTHTHLIRLRSDLVERILALAFIEHVIGPLNRQVSAADAQPTVNSQLEWFFVVIRLFQGSV